MSKLIVEIEMPSRCFECFARLSCERYTQELEMVDNFEELKALLPNDKCIIKGELVRCGECYYKEEKRIMDEDVLWCRKHHMYVTADWFCGDGERKDGAE